MSVLRQVCYILSKNYWHRSAGTQQRLVIIRTLFNRTELSNGRTGARGQVKLGNWLIACICESTGWFNKAKITVGNKTPAVISPTPEFLAIKDQVIANSELFSPEALPMLIEPNDWSPQHDGGSF